jgi:predicted nucleic acid-binding Zn ribbon protein
MPTYEFRAPDGSIIERVFKISEVPPAITLDDGRVATRIISGGAGLIFKGDGFYITDYGKDGKKDLRDAKAKADAKPEATPATPATPTPDAGKAADKPAASPAASSPAA